MPSLPSLRTALLATTSLISTTLLTLSIATLYLTAHYTHALDGSVPGGLYIWYGPIGSPERQVYWHDYDAGNLTQDLFHFDYDIENERWILGSAAVGLVAGLAGVAACLISCWNQRKTMNWAVASRFTWTGMVALVPTLISIAISVLSIYTTSHKQAVLSGSTCIPHSVPSSSNNKFLCTRELAACNFLENISMLGDDFDQQMCRETRASRTMLIPLVVVSVVLVVVGVAQVVLGGKTGTAVADLRVEKLRQKSEDWEEITVYESMRSVEKT